MRKAQFKMTDWNLIGNNGLHRDQKVWDDMKALRKATEDVEDLQRKLTEAKRWEERCRTEFELSKIHALAAQKGDA